MQIEHRMDAKRGNLIWLSDGRTEAAAALEFGIRIVHLSCAGKPNLFYSQPDDLSDGLATEAGWRIYGGLLVLTGEHTVLLPGQRAGRLRAARGRRLPAAADRPLDRL